MTKQWFLLWALIGISVAGCFKETGRAVAPVKAQPSVLAATPTDSAVPEQPAPQPLQASTDGSSSPPVHIAVDPPAAGRAVAVSPIAEEKQPPVRVEQLPVSITVRQPDSLGNVYMDATYTNLSTATVVSFQAVVLLKNVNEKAYLSCYDTVLPGQTSPKFDTYGPKTLLSSDIEFLKYTINVLNSDGSKTRIEYDNKLRRYSVD